MSLILKRRMTSASAALLCSLVLSGCASDAIFGFLRPRPEEAAAEKGQLGPKLGLLAKPGSYSTLLRLGQSTLSAGEPQAAVFFLRRAHQAEPMEAAPLVSLGRAYAMLSAYNEASEAYRAALTRQSENTEALRGLGGAMIALNQPFLAIDQFDAALRIDPSDYRSYNGMGVAYDIAGDHRAAQAHYRVGLAERPGDLSLQNNLALSLALTEDFEESTGLLTRLASDPTANRRHRLNLALVHGLSGDVQRAARWARRELNEDEVRDNLLYYQTLRAMGDSGKTAAVFGVYSRRPMQVSTAPRRAATN
jgi:Flp pilus assembly protein TadD